MPSSKKKQRPDEFNFEDFLGSGPDSGMQSAVKAMLGRGSHDKAAPDGPGINLIPGVDLIPGPNLDPAPSL